MSEINRINNDLVVDDMVYRPNLTEKRKKGELPEETECYVRVNGYICLGSIQYKNGCHNKKLPYVKSFNGQFITKNVEEVLAPVPNYEQWQAKLEENTKLKKLLKDCKEILWIEELASKDSVYTDELRILIKNINQVLGEE